MGLIASSAVACVACVREGCNLLRWARQREEKLSMIVIGVGGGNGGDIGGDGGGDGMDVESSGPARKETCSGKELNATALSMPRPSQSKQQLPLSGDWMMHFCTNFCTSLTGSNRTSRLSLLATLDAYFKFSVRIANNAKYARTNKPRGRHAVPN
jgi:hypothetical protein